MTLLAAGLRFYRASDPLWLDELHTAWIVDESWDEISPRAAIGNQSPLFFYFVWFSTQWLGMHELAVRLPSIGFGTLLVATVFVATYSWTTSSIAATLTSLLVAIDADCHFYAQEARPYVAVQLFGLVQVFSFSKLIDERPRDDTGLLGKRIGWRIAFVLSGTILFYLHYTAALLFGAYILCFVILKCTRTETPNCPWLNLVIDLAVIGLLIIPAYGHLWEIGGRADDWKAIVEFWPSPQMIRFVEVYLLTSLIGLGVGVLLGRCVKRRVVQPLPWTRTLLVACWLLAPAAIAWLVTILNVAPLAMFRYVVVSALAPIFVAGLCCAAMDSVRWRLGFAGVLLTVALCTSSTLYQWRQDGRLDNRRNENWPLVVERINQDDQCRNWPIYVGSGLLEDHALSNAPDGEFRQYCLFPVTSIYRIDTDKRTIEPFSLAGHTIQHPLPGFKHNIRKMGGAWIVMRTNQKFARALIDWMTREVDGKSQEVFTSPSLNLFKIAGD